MSSDRYEIFPESLMVIEVLWIWKMLGRLSAIRNPKIFKITKNMKSLILSRSGSQNTVAKLQVAAQPRSVEITCRGEASLCK